MSCRMSHAGLIGVYQSIAVRGHAMAPLNVPPRVHLRIEEAHAIKNFSVGEKIRRCPESTYFQVLPLPQAGPAFVEFNCRWMIRASKDDINPSGNQSALRCAQESRNAFFEP